MMGCERQIRTLYPFRNPLIRKHYPRTRGSKRRIPPPSIPHSPLLRKHKNNLRAATHRYRSKSIS